MSMRVRLRSHCAYRAELKTLALGPDLVQVVRCASASQMSVPVGARWAAMALWPWYSFAKSAPRGT